MIKWSQPLRRDSLIRRESHKVRLVQADPWPPAQHIQSRHPNARGYSASNLWRMSQFFQTYRGLPKLAPLVRELSWTHKLLIMSRSKCDEERELYLRMAASEKWGKRDLERQLNGALFERACAHLQKSQHRCARQLHPATVFKDSYLVEFLDRDVKKPHDQKKPIEVGLPLTIPPAKVRNRTRLAKMDRQRYALKPGSHRSAFSRKILRRT